MEKKVTTIPKTLLIFIVKYFLILQIYKITKNSLQSVLQFIPLNNLFIYIEY